MRNIKRITAFLMCIFMLCSFLSCGEYKPATDKGEGSGQGGTGNFPGGSEQQPDMDEDPANDFTVQLRVNEQPFKPTVSMSIYWNDGYNVHIAPVDDSGCARIDGLDGDYRVTLSAVPSGYAYDSNAYTATNDNRNIIIDMYDLNLLRGAGTGLYECYEISTTGVYTVTLQNEGDLSYIQFAPQTNGVYTVESWVNAVEDDVSPICMAYLGSSQYKYGEYRVTDVGVCGSYTRNFIHTVNIADDNISTGGGSQTFTFAVGAETKSGVYPVNLTFAVKRNGGFDLDRTEKTTVLSTQDWSAFDFEAFNALAGGTIVGAETLYPGTDDCYIFDEDKYRVWEISEGGDGVYHLYDKEKYPETNGFGPILVGYISAACKYLPDAPFTEIDEIGFGALTKVQGLYNYKLFIEGFEAAANAGYYCTTDCLCHLDGSLPACLHGCADCSEDCTTVSAEQMATRGYADFCNSDGVAPVTRELALFFQRYAEGQRFFADGGGTVDGYYPVDAYEDSQWLFGCGYYIE